MKTSEVLFYGSAEIDRDGEATLGLFGGGAESFLS